MDHGDVPEQLKGLTAIEEILISPVVPIMQVYHRPLGQYGYSGNIINLPQDFHKIAEVLPLLPKNCGVVVMRKHGLSETFKDFRVRRHRVEKALLFLINNNPFFKGINMSRECLNLLPEDGQLDIQLIGNSEKTEPEEYNSVSNEGVDQDANDKEEEISTTFVAFSESKPKRNAAKERRGGKYLGWRKGSSMAKCRHEKSS